MKIIHNGLVRWKIPDLLVISQTSVSSTLLPFPAFYVLVLQCPPFRTISFQPGQWCQSCRTIQPIGVLLIVTTRTAQGRFCRTDSSHHPAHLSRCVEICTRPPYKGPDAARDPTSDNWCSAKAIGHDRYPFAKEPPRSIGAATWRGRPIGQYQWAVQHCQNVHIAPRIRASAFPIRRQTVYETQRVYSTHQCAFAEFAMSFGHLKTTGYDYEDDDHILIEICNCGLYDCNF